MKRIPFLLILGAVACASSAQKPVAPAPAPPAGSTEAAAPGQAPALSRTNPNIVEETETSYVERLPKGDYIKVDDRHVKNPILGKPIEFFKEDDSYYYVSVAKMLPEERDAARQKTAEANPAGPVGSTPLPKSLESQVKVALSDFEDITPARVEGRIRLEEVQGTSLPAGGMWRASFVVADVNGDGLPDIVAPPARVGDGKLHIWLGDGKGGFQEWPLSFSEKGASLSRFSIDYGGVAVGDIDGDGLMDILSASHGGGLVSLFGDGKGGFEVVRTGLPRRDFSSQAVALLDVDGDGKPDLVASRDVVESEPNQPVDKMQVRVYVFLGRAKGWEFRKEGIVGGFYSNSLAAWDFDGDGLQDALTGSRYTGALTLLWKNRGDGTFSPVSFPEIEIYSYHFAAVPGTLGKNRTPAFLDSYSMHVSVLENARATGISLYAYEAGNWSRHRLWRQKDRSSAIEGMAMGDLDRDGLDDVVFLDNEKRRVRLLFQNADGSFVEAAEKDEPTLDSPGQCVRLSDLNRDGRLDIVVSKTVTTARPTDRGGWNVYLNRVK